MRIFGIVLFALGLGALGGYLLWSPKSPLRPEGPALVQKMREIARLETLEVTLYKKVRFVPDPKEEDSLWDELVSWARHSLRSPQGKALVFAKVTLGYDLEKLGVEQLHTEGDTVRVTLPPLLVRVELLPEQTEVIGSNLNTAETAELFALAKNAFEADVRADPVVQARARRSAETAIRALLLSAGYRDVQFDLEQSPVLLR